VIDDQLVVTLERLRDGLTDLRKQFRGRLSATTPVTAADLRRAAAQLAEAWLTELSARPDVIAAIPSDVIADLTVHFQRLLTFSEHATARSRYDTEIRQVLARFTLDVVVPLKKANAAQQPLPTIPGLPPLVVPPTAASPPEEFQPTAFVGHSFDSRDREAVKYIRGVLAGIGIKTVTGEKPQAARVSDKVKRLIEGQHMFVGVFTRRDKIARRQEWTTSPWIIDEKAYAYAKGKKLVLLREDGVQSIGGIQGDYEFIKFSRDRLHLLGRALLDLFDIRVAALRS
jgi:hypothetical protein